LLVNSLGWALAFRSGVGLLVTALLITPLVACILPKSRCCARPLGANMTPTAPVGGG
jgi:hypothetical protein